MTTNWTIRTLALAAAVAVLSALPLAGTSLVVDRAAAQGFQWPWETDDDPPPRRPPPQRQPDPRYQDQGPNQYYQQPGSQNDGWTARSSICLDLERRLVQETGNSGSARSRIPELRQQVGDLRKAVNKAERRLDRAGCFEEFLFSRSLRRTPQCLRIARQRERQRDQLARLEAQLRQLNAQTGQSYKDEIIRELARNNCGSGYVQEARRRNRNSFSPFWEDQDTGSGYANNYRALPFATYRTLCVRLCDGFYFPVSFSTLPNHFERDAEVCQSRCAAPSALYFHQNPGAGVDQMLSFSTKEPYTKLKEAFLYRKQYVDGCSCKQAEYVPQTPNLSTPPQPRAAEPPGDRAQSEQTLSPFR